ncbi:Inhibitor of Bruton tyrosine kinase, partial [Operophtera brumata]
KEKRRSRGKRAGEGAPRAAHAHCDPVELVQAAAKRLQRSELPIYLSSYKDGKICVKESAEVPRRAPAPMHWARDSFPELVDTRVCGKDGAPLPAHRCVLAARLDYFNGIKLLSNVTLPINHGILLPVINFLYTDSCPEVENCNESIDFICNMLIVADQLFISRLREMCEVALANMITLKNCTELCQFAHTYNATQLKQCCMEFISINLSSILENRSLEPLESALLVDITKYYCKFNPIMSSRVITPFYNAPNDETIEEFTRSYPVDLDFIDEDVKRDDIVVESTKKKKQSKKIEYTESEKARMRYESVSSVTSLDLSNEVTGDITLSLSKTKDKKVIEKAKWTEVPSSQQKQQKVVQARLKAISSAKDILNETPTETFTKLTKSSAITIPETPSPRTPMSPQDSPFDLAKSPQGNVYISHMGPKLSQKQRKKLAMEGNEQSPRSLNDYFNRMSVSPPEKPKNPWKLCELPVASSPSKPV